MSCAAFSTVLPGLDLDQDGIQGCDQALGLDIGQAIDRDFGGQTVEGVAAR